MKLIIPSALVCKCLLKHIWAVSYYFFSFFSDRFLKENLPLCFFARASPHLILHKRAWRGLLCMNMKRNLTRIQNNSLCCHAWTTLHCSTKCGPWFRQGTESSDVQFSVAPQATQACDWPRPTMVKESHIFPPQSPSSNRWSDCTADR